MLILVSYLLKAPLSYGVELGPQSGYSAGL
jgi:hypothetical protein